MSAEDTLRSNKTEIIEILCSDHKLILNKVQQKNLITDLEYSNLKDISGKNNWEHVVELVDKIMSKGEKYCRDFLDLLETDMGIKSTFPKLSNLQLRGAGPLPKPVQVSSEHSELFLGQDDNMDGVYPLNSQPVGLCSYRPDDCYPLNSQPVGLCLIINNVNITNLPVRRGSNKDAQNLAEVFSELGFRVLRCKNQTKYQMQQTLTWFSSLTDPALPPQEFRVEEWSDNEFTEPQQPLHHGDAFICCLLSDGKKGAVLGTDGSPVYIKDITRTFRATEQSPLKGKPKVFLIQASQGDQYMRLEEDNCGGCSIPAEADVVVAIAAGEGFVSYRHPVEGSLFFQSVCQQLREHCPRGEDLLTILQHVQTDVSQKRDPSRPDEVLQIPVVASNRMKKLVLPLHHH